MDILNYVSNHNSLRPKLVIGFAAETNNLENYSIKKLNDKNCDWIVANDVSNKNIGFNSDLMKFQFFIKKEIKKNYLININLKFQMKLLKKLLII